MFQSVLGYPVKSQDKLLYFAPPNMKREACHLFASCFWKQHILYLWILLWPQRLRDRKAAVFEWDPEEESSLFLRNIVHYALLRWWY